MRHIREGRYVLWLAGVVYLESVDVHFLSFLDGEQAFLFILLVVKCINTGLSVVPS